LPGVEAGGGTKKKATELMKSPARTLEAKKTASPLVKPHENWGPRKRQGLSGKQAKLSCGPGTKFFGGKKGDKLTKLGEKLELKNQRRRTRRQSSFRTGACL